MQSMDRNTIIGFVLLAGLLFAYLFISSKSSQELQVQKQRTEDSLAKVAAAQQRIKEAQKPDTSTQLTVKDTTGFQKAINGTEQTTTVETDLLKIVFSNKGGQPRSVELKKFQSFKTNKPVQLVDNATDRFSYRINTYPNQSEEIANLYFTPVGTARNADSSQTITYQLTGVNGETVTHAYTVKQGSYAVDWNVSMKGADKLLSQGNFNFSWKLQLNQHESDKRYEGTQTNICFYEGEEFDYIMSKDKHSFEKPVQWLGVAQQFFNTTIIAKTPFTSGDVSWVKAMADSSEHIAAVTANLQTKLPAGAEASIPMQLYFGPNDYKVLDKQAPGMSKMVNLGRDFYAFVRPINRYIIMPVFDFFKKFISSYGVVILLLTLFIRLLTSPLVYTSYLSGAKMKALRPELDLIRKRVGDDQQQFGLEQMKLFREAGVNPLGGCIPALLQIPIFFALYSFFNSNIALRGESFLWADNLASYDVIYRLPFTIPLNFGDHISLFTITAVATSFLISIYNMNMTPDQNNPMLKYMPYIFPFVLLFVFNQLPSALTWYYTVSNIITLILQWVIQNYIIDHDKILAKIEANKKKPKTKSKWQERMELIQEQQKRMQDTKKPAKK